MAAAQPPALVPVGREDGPSYVGRPSSALLPTEPGTVTPCRSAGDADLWFAEHTADVERAKALCRQCPVREACLTGAIRRAEPWGVWGGEVFINGVVAASKRGRGRPRKIATVLAS